MGTYFFSGIYPHEYMDSFERFDETKLSPKRAFYSALTEQGISDADCIHAQHIWDTFNLKTSGDYHNLYVVTDVVLLADFFENFT